jgi:hypothetical protein
VEILRRNVRAEGSRFVTAWSPADSADISADFRRPSHLICEIGGNLREMNGTIKAAK